MDPWTYRRRSFGPEESPSDLRARLKLETPRKPFRLTIGRMMLLIAACGLVFALGFEVFGHGISWILFAITCWIGVDLGLKGRLGAVLGGGLGGMSIGGLALIVRACERWFSSVPFSPGKDLGFGFDVFAYLTNGFVLGCLFGAVLAFLIHFKWLKYAPRS